MTKTLEFPLIQLAEDVAPEITEIVSRYPVEIGDYKHFAPELFFSLYDLPKHENYERYYYCPVSFALFECFQVAQWLNSSSSRRRIRACEHLHKFKHKDFASADVKYGEDCAWIASLVLNACL